MSYKFAIVGCGRIAHRHAANIIAHGGQLLAVCDTNPDKLGAFARKYACNGYNSFQQLLSAESPDLVVVCTPNGLHSKHSIAALNAGCHVLCEKPMAITGSDALEMISAAGKAGKRLFVVKQNRYNPPVVAVKKLLDGNKLGTISSFQVNCFWNRPDEYYQDEWRGTVDMDGGTLFTQFSHFIDLMYWFLGNVKSVSGLRANYHHRHSIRFEDTGIVLLETERGAIGTIQYTVNAYQHNMEGSISLFGEKGTVKIGGQYLNELDFFAVQDETMPEIKNEKPPNRYGFYEGSMSNHDKVYENLMRTLRDPSHEFVEAEEALKTVEIIEKIYKASPFIR
jgi:UDP-N-acetyl-2-amino-2-deoxyglucuronate dehydrogenase